ncbi:FadR family transcriptional regulator [Desulfopila sp. IMCC35006]|uniref:FadR/GntR family transcriptional regulator n=1 Tax=Desulfopila sp. IMCC35006 TaxID=2569542 RepID=UPI0010AD5EFA|nr:FadR/GntR family transcriptional regulator [Desulfopila sp. IMCC35006]TKB27099.1 FadR family transcriptional regulator [Desulfopila sp. IMCC35006]
MDIRPIRPKRVSSQVFEQLRELIYRGAFKPEQQFPPERDLAASMQVSRTSVRNAIDKLVNLGLLNHIQGHGTFVSSPEAREGHPLSDLMTTDEATYTDLLEVRMGLECNAAKLAATRATAQDLAGIRDCLEEMAADLATTNAISTAADAAFHMAVAFSTKNPVQLNLTRSFYDFLYIGIKKNLARMKDNEFAYQEVLEQHRTIYRHIVDREPQKAHDAMRAHILFVQDYFARHNFILEGIPMHHMAA